MSLLRVMGAGALVLAAALPCSARADEAGKSLVERLGFPAGTKVLIINADDFGMNQATNQATMDALRSGGITSATIMVPCGWFPMAAEFARENPQANLGVHTTLTSEWKRYKWGPVLGAGTVPSVVDEFGYFYPDVRQVYAHAKPEEVEAEVRAQIDKAIKAGIDVTHIDSHMGTLQYSPQYHEIYLQIAKDYNLPCRLAGRDLMRSFNAEHILDKAEEMGVLGPEHLYMGDPDKVEDTDAFWTARIKDVKPGMVSEIYIHPSYITPEMADTTGSHKQRTADSDFFKKPSTLELIQAEGIELISYRELRELQRTGKPLPRRESYAW